MILHNFGGCHGRLERVILEPPWLFLPFNFQALRLVILSWRVTDKFGSRMDYSMFCLVSLPLYLLLSTVHIDDVNVCKRSSGKVVEIFFFQTFLMACIHKINENGKCELVTDEWVRVIGGLVQFVRNLLSSVFKWRVSPFT